MRLIATVLLCLLIIGGTWIYTSIDNAFKREAAQVLYPEASGETRVSIERTFECYGDATFEEPAIQVHFQGEDVFVDQSEVLSSSTPIEFELQRVEVLENSFSVSANVVSPDSFGDSETALRAMLVKVHHNEKLIAEKMFHADGAAISIVGEVGFSIPQPASQNGHDH